jgi:hypothetical protein
VNFPYFLARLKHFPPTTSAAILTPSAGVFIDSPTRPDLLGDVDLL